MTTRQIIRACDDLAYPGYVDISLDDSGCGDSDTITICVRASDGIDDGVWYFYFTPTIIDGELVLVLSDTEGEADTRPSLYRGNLLGPVDSIIISLNDTYVLTDDSLLIDRELYDDIIEWIGRLGDGMDFKG